MFMIGRLTDLSLDLFGENFSDPHFNIKKLAKSTGRILLDKLILSHLVQTFPTIY
jgi:hypothetical protein